MQTGAHFADAQRENLADRLNSHLLTHALGAVARQRVGDFMAHHNGNPVVVLGDWHHAFPESDFTAGQSEGIDVLPLNDVELPLVVGPIGYRRDALTNPTQLGLPVASSR